MNAAIDLKISKNSRMATAAPAALVGRVRAEAALLEGVAEDDPTKVSNAFGLTEKYAGELLALKVKPTFHNASDSSAFFHSIASFGLEFHLGENIIDLAKRNGMMEALKVLELVEKRHSGSGSGSRRSQESLDAEAKLLEFVKVDNGEEIAKLHFQELSAGRASLLQLRVKETYQDASDFHGFYHSVASHGLKFQMGDTLLDLALRNEKTSAIQSLQHLLSPEEPGETKVQILVRNAMTGEELCALEALSSWTIARLGEEVAQKAPVTINLLAYQKCVLNCFTPVVFLTSLKFFKSLSRLFSDLKPSKRMNHF